MDFKFFENIAINTKFKAWIPSGLLEFVKLDDNTAKCLLLEKVYNFSSGKITFPIKN